MASLKSGHRSIAPWDDSATGDMAAPVIRLEDKDERLPRVETEHPPPTPDWQQTRWRYSWPWGPLGAGIGFRFYLHEIVAGLRTPGVQ
jgi:hypothetical protein